MLRSIPLYKYINICSPIHLRIVTLELFPVWGYYEEGCKEHLRTNIFEEICFHFLDKYVVECYCHTFVFNFIKYCQTIQSGLLHYTFTRELHLLLRIY